MKSEQITLSPSIRQHNIITTARYDYTACQLDILFYVLAQLKKKDKPNTLYSIQVKEIEDKTGRMWNYQQLRDATADMGSRMFEVESEQSYKQIWMFQKVEYIKGKGSIEVELSNHIRPFLYELKENFTSYQLQSALKLTSKYAKRIYQLASQWKDIGETKFYGIDEFKYMLMLKDPIGKEPEQFQNISQLKARVLDLAVSQINEHTDLHISYELYKTGRAFSDLRFFVRKQTSKQLAVPFFIKSDETNEQDSNKLTIARQHLATLGITQPSLVEQILKEKLDELFNFMYKLKTDKVKADRNPGGLFLKIQGLI
ncbi:replication initiation protein [Hymenobacter sp. BT186]|uniref:Replication initiation protein n=1 Tax=Hymenobacter telluris TaxID=2816474 RepID=A0A939F1I0_9BACT|nr:replication initiation protein [Hymenobacter telluris]MBO0361021.1 replication initiation protein [Hymenobacter telluris]MBW3377049.1 replication initiation protein [Hymenobacter norwichensis]